MKQEQKKQTQKEKKGSDQRDAGIAAENRPRPSQAEGDRDTIDQDLARKDGK